MSRDVIKHFPNGQSVSIFDPPIDFPDGEGPSRYTSIPTKRGMTIDTAIKNALERTGKLRENCHYQVRVPCVACSNCTIIQEWENGQYVNNAYFCKVLRGPCDRYGTCDQGKTGKAGPQVIQRNKTMEEIMESKGELIN